MLGVGDTQNGQEERHREVRVRPVGPMHCHWLALHQQSQNVTPAATTAACMPVRAVSEVCNKQENSMPMIDG